MRPRITTFDDPATLAEAILLYQDGASLKAIGNHYGCSPHTIHRTLTAAGIQLRPRGGTNPYTHTPTTDLGTRRPPTTIGRHLTDMPWYENAACRTTGDPAWFYPDRSAAHYSRQAKQVCTGCPVRVPCLTWAMENREEYGVWGGLSERERRAIMRRIQQKQGEAA